MSYDLFVTIFLAWAIVGGALLVFGLVATYFMGLINSQRVKDKYTPFSGDTRLSSRKKPTTILARSTTISARVSGEFATKDLKEGVQQKDKKTITSIIIMSGIASLILGLMYAFGFSIVAQGDDGGWVFIAVITLVIGYVPYSIVFQKNTNNAA